MKSNRLIYDFSRIYGFYTLRFLQTAKKFNAHCLAIMAIDYDVILTGN